MMNYKTWLENDHLKTWNGNKLYIKDLSLSQCKHLMKLIKHNDFKCLLSYHIQMLEFGRSNLNPKFSSRKYICNKVINCQDSGELCIISEKLIEMETMSNV